MNFIRGIITLEHHCVMSFLALWMIIGTVFLVHIACFEVLRCCTSCGTITNWDVELWHPLGAHRHRDTSSGMQWECPQPLRSQIVLTRGYWCSSASVSLAISQALDFGFLFSNPDIFEMTKYFCKRSFLRENVVHEHLRFKFLSDSEPWARSTIQSPFYLFYWQSR